MIFWTPQKRGSGTEVPVGSGGEAQVGGLWGTESPEADDIFRLKSIFLRKICQ